jgi:hypothetical protein
VSNPKTKHTAGPWVVDFVSVTDCTVRTATYPQRSICLVSDDVVGHRNPENAQLIAAAPELLEALELLNEALAEHGKMISTKQVKATKLAYTAIAKARGES